MVVRLDKSSLKLFFFQRIGKKRQEGQGTKQDQHNEEKYLEEWRHFYFLSHVAINKGCLVFQWFYYL